MNQYNDKYKRHGYWEHQWLDGSIFCKGYYINGNEVGYWEFYSMSGKLTTKQFHL
jgi:hypothetical protein